MPSMVHMAYSLSRYEMETTVNFNAEEKTAQLYTQDKSMIRRMDKMVAEFPDLFKLKYETSVGKAYEFPKKYAMPKRPRILTEEQRAQMAERMAKTRDERDETDAESLDDGALYDDDEDPGEDGEDE